MVSRIIESILRNRILDSADAAFFMVEKFEEPERFDDASFQVLPKNLVGLEVSVSLPSHLVPAPFKEK